MHFNILYQEAVRMTEAEYAPAFVALPELAAARTQMVIPSDGPVP
jgi:hypothetical protein